MKKIIYFALLLLMSKAVFAQNGDSCNSAIGLPGGNFCQNDINITGDKWFTYTPDSTEILITIVNPVDILTGHAHTVQLYQGASCNSLTLIGSAGATSANATTFELKASGLTIGNTYYIKVSRNFTGCARCIPGQATGKFNICIANLSPSTCLLGMYGDCEATGTNPFSGVGSCTVCACTPVTFINASFNGPGPNPIDGSCFYYYYWTCTPSLPCFPVCSNVASNVTCNFCIPGTYTVTLYESLNASCTSLNTANSHSVVITVLAPPVASFTINPNPGCIGSPVCFNNTSNFQSYAPNYSWDFGDGSPLAICQPPSLCGSTICHTYALPGTYNVSLTVTNGGCTSTTSQPVVINGPQPTITYTQQCQNITFNSTTPCPNAIQSWSWNFGDNTTSNSPPPVSHTYAPGTYTVTVTVVDINGQSWVSTVVVTVNSAPVVSITGSATMCDTTAAYCVNLSPGGSVVWNVPSGITFSTISTNCIQIQSWGPYFNTAPATLCAVVTDTSGCSVKTCITVNFCCLAPNTPYYFNDNTNTILAANPLAFTSAAFYINGTLTVNRTTTFTNCKVFMGQGAKIVINNGDTLTIESDNSKPGCFSHLKAGCGQMWEGIIVNPLARLEVESFILGSDVVLIEDAENAITSVNGGSFEIHGGWFNKNFVSVSVLPFAAAHPGRIFRGVFTCRNLNSFLSGCPPLFPVSLNTMPFDTLLPPHSGARSSVGVEITRVDTFTIGLPGSVYRNIFDNLDKGVVSSLTNITIVNNRFQNITGPPQQPKSPCLTGTAICANSTSLVKTVRNITVGGIDDSLANTFENCLTGVQVTDNMNSFIANNRFKNIGLPGISQSGCSSRTIDIRLNTITDAFIGIYCYNNPLSNTLLFRNKISLAGSTSNNARGIWVQDITPVSGGTTDITQNVVSEMRFGIKTDNKNAPQIINNTVTLKNITNPNFFGSGIATFNCTGGALVTSNHVFGLATGVCPLDASCSSSYFCNNAAWWLSGIRTDNSNAADIQCNDVQDCGDGIFAGGNMPNTLFTNNKMNGNLFRAFLGNYILLSNQGTGSNGSDNIWNTAGTFAYNSYTQNPLVQNSAALNCFYVQSSLNPGGLGHCSNLTPTPPNAFSFFTASGPWPVPCPVFKINPVPYLTQKLVQDSIPFSANVASNRVISKLAVFNAIPLDSALSSDPVLVSFRDSARNGDIGALDSISDNMLIPMTSAGAGNLLALNAGVTGTDTVSAELKTVNAIALNNIAVGQSNYSAAELHKLRKIAKQCPYTHGPAVYQARAILAGIEPLITEYWNDCEIPDPDQNEQDGNNGRTAFGKNSSGEFGKLYPNPASGDFHFEYKMEKEVSGKITIFNFLGETAGQYNLAAGENVIKILSGNMKDGMYFIKVLLSNGEEYSDKIIISR